MKYDMSDIKIRAMVEAQHSPREYERRLGSVWYDAIIVCNQCHEAWPCDARKQLLAWHEASATSRNAGEEWSDADAE